MEEEKEENIIKKIAKKQGKYFEEKVLPLLLYVGFIGAIISIIAYIIVVSILIVGFSGSIPASSTIAFAVINAVMGVWLCVLLRYQGVLFAKEDEESKKICALYYSKPIKKRRPQGIKKYWIKSIFIDIGIKGGSAIIFTLGVTFIAIQGSQEPILLLQAFTNLLLFASFGVLSLRGGYKTWLEDHVPFMIMEMKEEEERIENEKQEIEKIKLQEEKEIEPDLVFVDNSIIHSVDDFLRLDNSTSEGIIDEKECTIIHETVYNNIMETCQENKEEDKTNATESSFN